MPADITFPLVQNLDIGDVILGTAPLEIFGTLSFAMERDAILQQLRDHRPDRTSVRSWMGCSTS